MLCAPPRRKAVRAISFPVRCSTNPLSTTRTRITVRTAIMAIPRSPRRPKFIALTCPLAPPQGRVADQGAAGLIQGGGQRNMDAGNHTGIGGRGAQRVAAVVEILQGQAVASVLLHDEVGDGLRRPRGQRPAGVGVLLPRLRAPRSGAWICRKLLVSRADWLPVATNR